MANAKTNTKGTKTNANAKEKEVMKAKTTAPKTTKANANTKEAKTMKATSKGKATTKTSAKAKENTMKATEMVTATINGIPVTGTQEQIIAILNACATESARKNVQGKTTEKATGKGKSSAKKTATAKAEQPKTKAEAIEQWKSARYSEEERAEFGIAAKEVREEMMAENKKMVKTVKGKKVYDDNYYVGAKWTKEFNKRMKERGFKVGK